MEQTKKDAQELHGEEFVDGLDEMLDIEEGVEEAPPPTTKEKVMDMIYLVLTSKLTYYVAGVLDCFIIAVILKKFGVL